jgi:hypothetical protein
MHSSPLLGTKAIEIARLIQPVKDAKCMRKVGLGPVHDDAIRALGLNPHLVPGFQARCSEALDGKRHLVLGRDPGHAFTLA